ncbi:unnamed protein product [Allacma fusca]|uniref:Uncharacterized protein n=1 Tax=Allacma fusca TaxID=39272 RepID=A0A8J2NY29_9HEXA|nr:unnamed protein product [Allacma fusca]
MKWSGIGGRRSWRGGKKMFLLKSEPDVRPMRKIITCMRKTVRLNSKVRDKTPVVDASPIITPLRVNLILFVPVLLGTPSSPDDGCAGGDAKSSPVPSTQPITPFKLILSDLSE